MGKKLVVVWEVKDTGTERKVPVPQEDRVVGCGAPAIAPYAAELTSSQAEAGGGGGLPTVLSLPAGG